MVKVSWQFSRAPGHPLNGFEVDGCSDSSCMIRDDTISEEKTFAFPVLPTRKGVPMEHLRTCTHLNKFKAGLNVLMLDSKKLSHYHRSQLAATVIS